MADSTALVNTQLDILLQQVIAARVRVDGVVHDAKVAAKTLASLQRQVEAALVKDTTTAVDGDQPTEGHHHYQ